jgi:hypothetical protein
LLRNVVMPGARPTGACLREIPHTAAPLRRWKSTTSEIRAMLA